MFSKVFVDAIYCSLIKDGEVAARATAVNLCEKELQCLMFVYII